VDSRGQTIFVVDAHRDGSSFIVRADKKGLIDLWACDLCERLRNYRVNDHANPDYRRDNNSNSAGRESYDDDLLPAKRNLQPNGPCTKVHADRRTILNIRHYVTLIAACA
jgi:hypothetical protein